MRSTQTKLSLQQKMLFAIFTATALVLFFVNFYNIQQVKSRHEQQARQLTKNFRQQSFSFVMTGEGDVVGSSRKSTAASPVDPNRIFDQAGEDLSDRLALGQKFSFTASHGDQDYSVTLNPIKMEGHEGLTYVGNALPEKGVAPARAMHTGFIWITALAALLIIGVVVWYTIRIVARPADSFNDLLADMARGDVDSSSKISGGLPGIWQQLADYLNRFVDHYTEKIKFASEVARGNIDVSLTNDSEEDRLGAALIQVRDSLKQAKEDAQEREKEEEKRRWANEGIAQFADLLRRNHDKLEELSYSIISNLVKYLDANQGGIFLLNDNDPEDTFFELKAAYAFDRKKYLDKKIQWGEGLVGTVARERKHVYMTELPQDYINITSGLGDANPDSLLIMPLQTDEEVVGVLEIACFKELEQYHIDFVHKVAESIASTISSMKINIKTNELLEKSQQQAEEMSSQEEEMRQNMEEMQATQEELSRKIKDNEEMHNQLSREKALLDALMNNLPDYIYFKDRDSKFIRISQSMLPLFPVDSIEEMIGKSDFDFHQADAARDMYEEEQDIIRNEKGFHDKLQHEVTETGKDQWVSVTKLPLYDPDGQLMGTFGISKDVTRYKQLEMGAKEGGDNPGAGDS